MTLHSLCFCFLGNKTDVSFCKTCPLIDLNHGETSYTDPTSADFGPRQEGSQVNFVCDGGYALSHSGNSVTCREGEWAGAIPTCVVDHCADVYCGGESECINSNWEYTCECAEGWSGGGVNATCQKGICECSGNKGYWRSDSIIVDGTVKVGYNYGAEYGNKCIQHDLPNSTDQESKDKRKKPWVHEPWYVHSAL